METKSREREQKFDARALHCRYVHWTRKQTARSSTDGHICDQRQTFELPFWSHPAYDTFFFFFHFFSSFFLTIPTSFSLLSFFFFSTLPPPFTCNTSVRNRVALNESVGVYRSWQYFKSALLRQMQRVGQVRPGIHLNSLLRHI